MPHRLIEPFLRHPWILAAAAGLLALASLLSLVQTRVDNALEVWLVKDDEAYLDYRRFMEAFGSEEFILAALQGDGILEAEGLEVIREAGARAAKVPGIKSVLSPATILDRLDLDAGEARKVLLATPTYLGFLVAGDGKTAALYLDVDPGSSSRPRIVSDLREALAFVKEQGFGLHLGGPPVLNAELNDLSSRDPRLLFPVVFAVTMILLALLFRGVAGVLVPIATVLFTVLVSLAAVDLAGRTLNMITVGFPTVLWVLGLSQSIHLLTAYGRGLKAGRSGYDAVAAAVVEVRYPCLLMSVTTAAGFLSLLFSSVGPVRELGAYTAGGILLGFAVNFTLGPVLLLWGGSGGESLKIRTGSELKEFKRTLTWFWRRPVLTLGAVSLMMLASVLFALRIEVETNALKFLRPDNPVAKDYRFIQEHLVGLSSLEIDLANDERAPLSTLLAKVDAFSRALYKQHPEARALSIDDFLKAAAFHMVGPGRSTAGKDSATLREEASAFYQASDPAVRAGLLPMLRFTTDLDAFITREGDRLRIAVFSPHFAGGDFEQFQRYTEEVCRAIFGSSARVTGIVRLLVAMQEYLAASQVKCLGAALGIILVFMLLAARTLGRGLVCMVPNIFPVALNFGIMGLLNVKLDAATMMIASVAIGIAVDNTIHMIVAFRRFRERGEDRNSALRLALDAKGQAILYTTLVTCLGFLVLAFSIFLPMGWFGGLTALTIFWAMAGDLLILPALLTLMPEKRT